MIYFNLSCVVIVCCVCQLRYKKCLIAFTCDAIVSLLNKSLHLKNNDINELAQLKHVFAHEISIYIGSKLPLKNANIVELSRNWKEGSCKCFTLGDFLSCLYLLILHMVNRSWSWTLGTRSSNYTRYINLDQWLGEVWEASKCYWRRRLL